MPIAERGPDLRIARVSEIRGEIEMMRMIGLTIYRLEDRPRFEWRTFTLAPRGGVTWSGRTIAFPCWLAAMIGGIWPAFATVRWLRRRRRPGRCRSCGYDLRGSPSGVCPECGMDSLVSAHEAYIARWETRRCAPWKLLGGCFFTPPVIVLMLTMVSEAWRWFEYGQFFVPNLVEVAATVIVVGSLGLIGGAIFIYAGLWRMKMMKARLADRQDDASA
jgi:hypothetical protein